uniref:C2 DOCK-type domain-containing protein n=2 Tax=Amphimedon queenslandica TaxID=400682 RepID=A0A1X7T5W0_AMPQE
MEEWLLTLGKAIGLIEEEDTTSIKGSVAAKYRSYYAKDTLRDTTKKTLHRPELLHWDDKKEREDRNKNRNDLFLLYPELLHQAPLDDTVSLPLPYKEVLHHQVTVICKELSLKLTLSRHGKKQLLEPFYVRLSLFDAAKGMKISEDFHIDFNESESLIRDDTESTDDTDINKLARTTNQALFSVTFPHPEVFIVARIEKVLQGGISTCTEPYMKPTDSLKMVDKFSKQVTSVRERLGQYRMPFAWAAKPLFLSEDEVNVHCTDLGPIYRQEREKLTDTELIKILSDFKNIGRHKLQTIPGSLNDRSELISSEFTENIETLLLFIITQSCNDTNNGLKGIVSVAKFIKQCFSFIDRGLVFNLIDKSIEVLDSFDTQFVSELRLDFLSYVCEHEHFIPLNLPFKTKPVLMTFYINDEYCTDHYLAGLLLREVSYC